MDLFKKKGISDENLSSPTWPDLATLEPPNTRRSNKIWSSNRIKLFQSKRWEFLAPVFSTTKMFHGLPSSCILPFIWKGDESNRGAFGTVRKYEIHPNHIEPVSLISTLDDLRINAVR